VAEETTISKIQLSVIEKSLDKLFNKLGIDVEFGKHFFERINDSRNGKQITISELINIYHSLYDKHGIKLSKTDDEVEELVKSLSTDINIPLHIEYNRKSKMIELSAKTIMRKKNFQSTSKVLAVESFKTYLEKESLDEALITFNKKAYPKFGQVVILAGGAGSGKGFIQSKLLGIEGRVVNVDDVKSWVMKSVQLAGKIKELTGFDLKTASLKNTEDVSKLHDIVSGMKIADNIEKALFTSIATSDTERKPNIIFDVTLKDLDKLDKIARNVIPLGYDKKNIHIVWIVNQFEKAKEQNLTRERSVSDAIMVSTHKGAAMTMHDLIFSNGINVQTYMDGDIWVAFNLAGKDATITKSDFGGSFIEKGANYVKVKETGKKPNIDDAITKKIGSYVPDTGGWKK